MFRFCILFQIVHSRFILWARVQLATWFSFLFFETFRENIKLQCDNNEKWYSKQILIDIFWRYFFSSSSFRLIHLYHTPETEHTTKTDDWPIWYEFFHLNSIFLWFFFLRFVFGSLIIAKYLRISVIFDLKLSTTVWNCGCYKDVSWATRHLGV